MSTLSTILAAILGIVFVASGIPKITGQQAVAENFRRWGYADVVRTATGWLEVLTGTLLLVGIALPFFAVTGSMLVIMIMVGALFTHQRAHDPLKLWVPALVLLVLDLVLAYSMLP
jgi:putative oxidoreductase